MVIYNMEIIFNLFKVKFTKLDELLTKHCKEIDKDSTINLFINFESVMKKLLSSNIEEYFKVKDEQRTYEMISNIINLISHYRLFFSKNNLYSKIFIYLSYPLDSKYYKNKNILPNYRNHYQHKYSKDPDTFIFSDVLTDAVSLTKIILEYIEGVYLITSDNLEASLIPNIVTKYIDDNSVNFILTTDRYEYQYVNKDFYIIVPKQDNSYIINKNNLIDTIKLEEKIVNKMNVDNNYYSFIYSLLGDKYRNIEKIKHVGLSTIIKMINKGLETNILSKDVYNINILSNIIKDEYKKLLLDNFYCVDLDTQYKLFNIKDLYTITSQIIDKFDNVSLKKINDEYFTNYPLYLMEITSSNNLIKKKEKKNIFI
jgi:hypothetical protein